MAQVETEFGFFAWLHEKLSTHPHLPKRLYILSEFFAEESTPQLKENKSKMILGLVIAIVISTLIGAAGWFGFKALDKLDLWSEMLQQVEGTTPLMKAASENDTEKITTLLKEGADIHEVDNQESTALHWAVFSDQYEAAKLLLEKGADPNTVDLYETTPLMSAVFTENEQMVSLLLENGADPSHKDSEGYTAYDYAKDYENEAIMELLKKY